MSRCGGGKSFPNKGDVPQNHSLWMAHWTCKTSTLGNEAQVRHESREESHNSRSHSNLHGQLEIEVDGPKLVKGFGEVSKMSMLSYMNESLTTSSGKLRNEMFESQSFPMFKSSWNRESVPANGESSCHHEEVMRSQIGPSFSSGVLAGRSGNSMTPVHAWAPKYKNRLREYYFQHEGIRWHAEEHSSKLLGKSRLVASPPFQKDIAGSSSKFMPYELKSGKTATQSSFSRQDDINPLNAAFFVHEKNMNGNAAQLMQDTSTTNNLLRNSFSKKLKKMPHHSGMELCTTEISSPDVHKLEKLCHGSDALPKIPSSVHGMETMRMCTSGFSIDFPKFSHATHHFFITEKTDLNLPENGQMFGHSSKYRGKTVSKLLGLSPDFGFPVKQGVKLQPLDSSTESEEKENLENIKASVVNLKNESSAKTDTMDMDVFQENHLSGVKSSPSNKDVKGTKKSPTSRAKFSLLREEIESRLLSTELHDMNQELPAVAGRGSSECDRDMDNSRTTPSLDVWQFLSHAEHPTNSKSRACHDSVVGLDPCSRWVKRLKPSASDSFALSTKSITMEETSSHEKVSKLFNNILKCGKTTLEPITCKSHGTEPIEADQTAELHRNAVSSSIELVRNTQDIMLSHTWIQRWCHNPVASPKKKPVSVVGYEPQSSKATLSNLQKKKLPSIAAMALMGKAMTSFCPCEFTKRGALLIWNTKGC